MRDRIFAGLLLLLVSCRDTPTATTTHITAETRATAATSTAPLAGDAACASPCGPSRICCGAHDKCCAEGAAAHFYCYAGPGDCPMRP